MSKMRSSMRIGDTIKTAYRGMRSNIFRAFLTMLGIIIGVGSVVLMTGVGESMEGVILGQISSLGAKSMVIFPGNGGPEEGAATARPGYDSMKFSDIEELEKLESVANMAPVIFIPGDTNYGRESSSPTIYGTNEKFFSNQSIEVDQGRLITEADDEKVKFVAVLGPDVVEDLFPGSNPIGKRIKIADRTFTVVGVTESVGTQFFQNADERIFVPLSVARSVTGQKHLSYMTFEATDTFDRAFADVKYVLRKRHGIVNPEEDPDKDDFTIRSSAQAQEILGTVSLALTVFITFVASISLIVGGIGIMNIMLVAVTERTREIGLRKAVGAKGRHILLQFLIEAILLTFVGGIIGATMGVVLSWLAANIVHQFLASYIFAISPIAIVVSLLTALFTGLIFGINPARKAAALNPIEALRYE
ncbi:FtsX-like permease family protein [Candidatus Peribacteria bacterium]|nr:FtsX-like permease family protein [Candidatus Peribacteria bacterium]MBT4240488.1 FtsX-like permease family protein [Candidatus Peribacteria bacterium]